MALRVRLCLVSLGLEGLTPILWYCVVLLASAIRVCSKEHRRELVLF